jgi:hypothetical protein
MQLPIVPTTHVPSRDQIIRAWLRALETVGGSTDGLTAHDTHQRVLVPQAKGAPLHDVAFGFSSQTTPSQLPTLLAQSWPKRIVPDPGWDASQIDQALNPHGYRQTPLSLWALSKTSLTTFPDSTFQVLPGRAVYKDVQSLDTKTAKGLTFLMDEPKLDMLVLRSPSGPVSAVSVLTINTTGLILDLTFPDPTIPGLADATLWFALELCARSQHKSVAAVLAPDPSHNPAMVGAGFVGLPSMAVWDRG